MLLNMSVKELILSKITQGILIIWLIPLDTYFLGKRMCVISKFPKHFYLFTRVLIPIVAYFRCSICRYMPSEQLDSIFYLALN